MKIGLRSLALATLCSVVAFPAFAADAPAEKPRRGGSLRLTAWTEPENLNPILVQNGLEREISRLMFLDAIFYDDKAGWTTPLLTEFPSLKNKGISKDGKRWTLRLKKGIRWQDGVEVTSADFKFSYERSVDPKVEYPAASDLKIIERVDTPDKYTAVFVLKKPSGLFFELVPLIVPKHLLENSKDFNHDPFSQNPVGNGPFQLEEWKHGSHLILKRRADAPADGPPYLDRVVFQFIPDENARWIQVQSGGADWHRTTFLDIVEKSRADKRLAVHTYENINWTHLAFNTSSAFLSDHRVREAIVRAIDKESIAKNNPRQRPRPIYSVTAPASPLYTEDVPRFPYDPALAAKLLDEAGWKMGSDGMRAKDGKPLALRVTTLTGQKAWGELQVIFQDSLKKVGIALTVESEPGSRLYAPAASNGTLASGTFDMAIAAWGGYGPRVLSKQLWHSGSIPPDGSNYYRYKNSEVDRLLDKAEATLDPEAQLSIQRQAMKLIAADLPVWPLYVYEGYHITTAKLRNYRPGAFSSYIWNAQDWWLAE